MHAVLRAVDDVVTSILHDQRRVLTVSMRLTGMLGLSGVCLSLPGVVGRAGLDGHIIPHLDDTEREALHDAGEVVAKAVEALPGTSPLEGREATVPPVSSE